MSSITSSVGSGNLQLNLREPLCLESSSSLSRAGVEIDIDDPSYDYIDLTGGNSSLRLTDKDCNVCAGKVFGPKIKVRFACRHFFHYECVLEALKKTPECPMCEADVNRRSILITIQSRALKIGRIVGEICGVTTFAGVLTGLVFYLVYYRPEFHKDI